MKLWDIITGSFSVHWKGRDGAALVTIDGALTAVSGNQSTRILNVNNTPTDADAKRYNDATGCKAFRLALVQGATAATDNLIVGWSTSAGDFSSVNTKLTTAATQLGTPTGVELTQIISVLAGATTQWSVHYTDYVMWDGTSRIKTIVPHITNATAIAVALELIT